MKFLTPSTANEYTAIDSFPFAEGICQQDPSLDMASLGVDSLFTNIPLDKTIDICVDNSMTMRFPLTFPGMIFLIYLT